MFCCEYFVSFQLVVTTCSVSTPVLSILFCERLPLWSIKHFLLRAIPSRPHVWENSFCELFLSFHLLGHISGSTSVRMSCPLRFVYGTGSAILCGNLWESQALHACWRDKRLTMAESRRVSLDVVSTPRQHQRKACVAAMARALNRPSAAL